ncbi:MAG: hypothetical protein AAF702_44575 [Chloroflexota bacterium]
MSITISTAADEQKMEEYRRLRDAPRLILANGVYPNCVSALSAYDDLLAALIGDYSDYDGFHNTVTAGVQPHIAAIRAAMEAIVTTMRAIETAAPGTFNISIPAGDSDE